MHRVQSRHDSGKIQEIRKMERIWKSVSHAMPTTKRSAVEHSQI